MKTLLLAQDTWDFVLDLSGNIALAAEPYAVAQDVASAARVFIGEMWYNTAAGVPYSGQILAEQPSIQFMKSQIEAAALTVPTVVQARCLFVEFSDRLLVGQIEIIDATGAINNVSF